MTMLVSLPSQSGKSVPGSRWLQPQGAQAGGGPGKTALRVLALQPVAWL